MVVGGMSATDLRVPNVPLAQIEDDDPPSSLSNKSLQSTTSSQKSDLSSNDERAADVDVDALLNNCSNEKKTRNSRPPQRRRSISQESNSNGGLKANVQRRAVSPGTGSENMENQGFGEETFGGSLEDLVENFDEKITHCFKNLNEATDDVAPVQMRSQDEIMSESQIWWTLTGNFGNILPLDWSKTQARKLQLPALNLRPKKDVAEGSDAGLDLSEDDEELRQALDMHQLITEPHSAHSHDSVPQTADQVIEEIDEIMQQSCDLNSSVMTDRTMESVDSMYSSMRSPLPGCSIRDPDLDAKIKEATALASSAEKLQALPYNKLVALHAEMEQLIQVYNESLVQELALKDELEYEKELKNTFISLLLSIQNKRRQFANDRKRKGSKADPAVLPQFITASVPYQDNTGPPDNASLQALIKILRAVNEDNPAVPTILTDYILTVVCPSALSSGFAQ